MKPIIPIFLFMSDNEGLAREGEIREPMIAYWPKVTTAGSTCDQYLIIEDFYPTI